MQKDSIRTRAVTFDTAKYFIIPIETLFKDLSLLFKRQHKLWNDAQLRTAAVTRCSWYIAANTTVFQLCGLIKTIEHVLSLKFYLNF